MAERDYDFERGQIIIRDKQFGENHTLVIDIEREYTLLKKLRAERHRAPVLELPDSQ